MPELSEVKLPKTVNEAINILAYNDFFYKDDLKSHINPHPKDRETITSLAEAQYPWTEKQGKLAVIILKRYLTKFQKHKMDIKELLDDIRKVRDGLVAQASPHFQSLTNIIYKWETKLATKEIEDEDEE